MNEIQNLNSNLYLGIDGGQSHTEAIIADENGNILGRGFGGASNHAEQPGGRERLRNAILNSVSEALKNAELPGINDVVFTSAHCGMTGGADYKEEIIGEILKAEKLVVNHDAATALFGATAGEPGVVVIAGTGSATYGENADGQNARAGGLGFLFSDEGSGFSLATQTIRLAIKEQDGLIEPDNLEKLVTEFFGRERIRFITTDFYNGKISRDEIAKLAQKAHEAAENGNQTLKEQINYGTSVLAASVKSVAKKLNMTDEFMVAGVGGMFRAPLTQTFFAENLREQSPKAIFIKPRFGPAIGALLLAYKQANREIGEKLLSNLHKTENK